MRKLFDEVIRQRYKDDKFARCPNITLQVTDDCCLNCSYCYQINKGHRMMTNETAKKCIDLLFSLYDQNNEESAINHHSKGIILDFIGGEPFMNIDTIFFASEYFINECLKKDHQWLNNFKFSITSNGMLYFQPAVQKYLKQFQNFIDLGITIDGPEELHNSCRKDFMNNGSFQTAIAAFEDWQFKSGTASTKVTIAPENLQYLSQIISFFIEYGCTEIHANPIFEHLWTVKESKIYYNELKIIANTLLEYPNLRTNLFHEKYGKPMLSSENKNYCGGTGAMLAFDPDGNAYPCLRYMESSLGTDIPPLIIGNVNNGIYNTKETQDIYKNLTCITRRSQSSDECFNCQIASGCAWCSAWNYQQFGTVNKRSTNICWMQRARSLVNSYYYNMKYQNEQREKRIPIYLNRELATQIISDTEYDNLLINSYVK